MTDLTLTIRDHLGLDTTTPPGKTWEALGRKQALIVLDNAEECAQPQAYADCLNALELSGGTRVLMTSRSQWRELRNAKSHDLKAPNAQAAVAILRAMAAQEPPAYPLDGYETALAEAARHHPKLIWYAIRWANDFPPAHVLTMLQMLQGEDAQAALEDIVKKTIHLVEQRDGGPQALAVLRRLAVCRGGFTFEAAQAIMGADIDARALAILKQWGLVSFAGGRYDVDPLVIAAVGEDESAHWTHYDYYHALALQHHKKQDYAGLDRDAANLEAAFEWAAGSGDAEAALWLANACGHFLSNRVRFDQRLNWFERAATMLEKQPDRALWANAQNSLGAAHWDNPIGDHRTNLKRAIAAYTEA